MVRTGRRVTIGTRKQTRQLSSVLVCRRHGIEGMCTLTLSPDSDANKLRGVEYSTLHTLRKHLFDNIISTLNPTFLTRRCEAQALLFLENQHTMYGKPDQQKHDKAHVHPDHRGKIYSHLIHKHTVGHPPAHKVDPDPQVVRFRTFSPITWFIELAGRRVHKVIYSLKLIFNLFRCQTMSQQMHVLWHMTRSDAKGAAAAAPSVQLCGDIHPIALHLSELFSKAEVTETLDSKMKTRIKILPVPVV